MTTGLGAMAVVALYVAVTVPFLVLLLKVHGWGSDYTRWLLAALALHLVPVGLLFFPLGLVGTGVLAFSLVEAARRNRGLRRLHIDNVLVARRWSEEYRVHLWALALSLEQKAVAWLFLEVAGRRAGLLSLGLFLGFSLVVWGVTIALVWQERRHVTAG